MEFEPPEGLTFESLTDNPHAVYVTCRVPSPPEGWGCPTCRIRGEKFGGSPRTLHDLPRNGKRVVIHWYQPRVRCPQCRKVFQPVIAAAISPDHRQLSTRLVDLVASRLRNRETLKAISAELLVSHNTAWRIARSQGIPLPPRGRQKSAG